MYKYINMYEINNMLYIFLYYNSKIDTINMYYK